MKITDVKVFPVDEDKLKAYATITFDNCFIVRDLKVISGNKGYFIAMPSKKRKDGTFRDVAHPLNSETRKMIEEAVLQVYEAETVAHPGASSSYDDIDAMDGQSPLADAEGDTLEDDRPEEVTPDEDLAQSAAEENETAGPADEETSEEESLQGDPGPVEPEEREKGAEENPVVEPSDDPEKAFGYEE